MPDFFEIDFLDVETKKSGDAIPLRYEVNGQRYIHLVDGGYRAVSEKIIRHVQTHYDDKPFNHVVLTHPDGDHAAGLYDVLETCNVGALWMLRPWQYANELIPRFETYNSVDRLESRLRAVYPTIARLEEIALERGIPIFEPFQGQRIGAFTVLAPSKQRYLDLIVKSERTPEAVEEDEPVDVITRLLQAGARAVAYVRGAWGHEVFSPEETSAENEMSVIQYAAIAGQTIVLTGDAGRGALTEAADFAPYVGLQLPGVSRFQVPHHGSRRNVSTELLDRWLGPRLEQKPFEGQELFTAICSSAKEDKDHPRKSVERAFVHRGARFLATEGVDICTFKDSPPRQGWVRIAPRPYPEDFEQ